MKAVLVIGSSLLLSACTAIREHPFISALVVGSVAATVALSADGSRRGDDIPSPDVHLPAAPECKTNPSSCQ